MRIVLDLQGAQTLGSRNRGIGRYSKGLASGMARVSNPEIDLRIMLNGAFPDTIEPIIESLSADLPRSAFSIYSAPAGTYPPPVNGDPVQTVAREAVRLHLAKLEPDVVLTTSVMEGFGQGDVAASTFGLPDVLSAAILYDLTPLHDPEVYLGDIRTRAFYERQIETLRSFDALLSISEASRLDAISRLDLNPDTIITINAATDAIFQNGPRQSRSEKLPKNSYILLLGGTDPNKNLMHAINAFSRLPENLRQRWVILHAGVLSEKVRYELVEGLGDSGEIYFLGHVTDVLLINAIDHADLVLFPSRLEGFGLPALEAMSRGTPVLASNNTSLPEVVGDDALLSDPDDPGALTKNIERLLRDPAHRTELGVRARDRAIGFSWDNVGRTAITALDAAVRSRGGKRLRRPSFYEINAVLKACAGPVSLGALTREATVASLIFSGSLGREIGPPRLLIDVTQTSEQDHGTGIQRVVNRTVEHLQEQLGTAQNARQALPVVISSEGMRTAPSFGAAEDTPVLSRAGETLLMLDSSWSQYLDFTGTFKDVRRYGGRIVTVVYDLVPLLHSNVVHVGMIEVFERWFRRALVESHGIVCISRAVADDVVAYIRDRALPHRDGLRIGWWHLGSDLPISKGDYVRPPRAALEDFWDRPGPVFLMIGTIEPRKRHEVALDAIEKLWARGSMARLLIMGREGWNIAELTDRLRKHPEMGRKLLWVEEPSDSELTRGYAAATSLLFPSVYEGYGLPVVEAARAGLGAICSDIPVLREVGGGALYAPVDDVPAWAKVMDDVIAGRRRANPSDTLALSWSESTAQLLEVLYADRWYKVLRWDGTHGILTPDEAYAAKQNQ